MANEEHKPQTDRSSVPDAATGSPANTEELTPQATGRWPVKSRGSEHLFDLDAMTYERTPGPGRGSFATTVTGWR